MPTAGWVPGFPMLRYTIIYHHIFIVIHHNFTRSPLVSHKPHPPLGSYTTTLPKVMSHLPATPPSRPYSTTTNIKLQIKARQYSSHQYFQYNYRKYQSAHSIMHMHARASTHNTLPPFLTQHTHTLSILPLCTALPYLTPSTQPCVSTPFASTPVRYHSPLQHHRHQYQHPHIHHQHHYQAPHFFRPSTNTPHHTSPY